MIKDERQRSKEPFRQASWLLGLGLVCPLFFTQCKTSGYSYQDVEYDPAKLKTPDGHGMVKEDYPFDDSGQYRKDWVRNKDQGRASSSFDRPDPEPTPSVASPPPASVAGGIVPVSGPGSMVMANYPNSVSQVPESSVVPISQVSDPADLGESPTYHRVMTGETLYSLSRRYGTSVDELKRINGLSSDQIRSGQSLRVP
ncbi:MAG: LysM peptidoglycan-binding domain-containing protein [Verrucomicrobiota bacterium]